jgi:hypothetical protein
MPMNIYRNHYIGREKRSKGYSFHLNTVTANGAKKDPPKGTVEVVQDVIDAQLNKQGVIELLRKVASHPNNK